MTYVLTHGVVYTYQPDGTLDIQLLQPWDGKRRFERFPVKIRLAVHLERFLHTRPEEYHKLYAAEAISEDVYNAVLDDILCAHATRLVSEAVRDEQQASFDNLLIYRQEMRPWQSDMRRAAGLQPEEPDRER